MTTKHTPGPWVVTRTKRATTVTEVDGSEIASVFMLGIVEQGRANAALIAAAPELLAVLLDARELVDYLANVGNEAAEECFRRIEAVVAKANGETR